MKPTPRSDYDKRIRELKDVRNNVGGININDMWRRADKDYVPHRIGKSGKRVMVQDEDLGYASRMVTIGKNNWQSDVASANPYIKINTALSILISRNPSVDLIPASERYEDTTILQEQLYKKSWELAKSVQQLKLFTFNLAKYGFAAGRSYPRMIKGKSKILTKFNPDDPQKNEYETRESTEFNGIFRESINPWYCWLDDKTKPNNTLSTRDWVYADWTSYDLLKKEFGKYKDFKFIKEGNSQDIDELDENTRKNFVSKNMKLVHFYENLDEDVLTAVVDGIPILEEPLPVSDSRGTKKLSLWHTYWTLRDAETPYGIGIPEAIRQEKGLYDKFKNMTNDQIVLSIYKMFFYEGTDQMTGDGTIRIKPGVGKQVTNPANIKFLEVPGPGKDAYNGIEMQQKAIDAASGINPQLEGEVIGKTAYESAQATEFALRRLQTPLGNITDALEQEARITMSLNQMIYSVPEVIKIVDKELIAKYIEEVQGNTDLYERDEEGNFFAKLYQGLQMNLDTGEDGKLIESENSKFFRVLPKGISWDGTVTVKGQSILVETKALSKQMTSELFNLIAPLLAQPKEIALKPVKELCKKYEVDWKDWVPDFWIEGEGQEQAPNNELFIPQDEAQQATQATQAPQRQTMQNPTVLPKNEVRPTRNSIVNKTAGLLGGPARAMGR